MVEATRGGAGARGNTRIHLHPRKWSGLNRSHLNDGRVNGRYQRQALIGNPAVDRWFSTLLSHSDRGQRRAALGQSETRLTVQPRSAFESIADPVAREFVGT